VPCSTARRFGTRLISRAAFLAAVATGLVFVSIATAAFQSSSSAGPMAVSSATLAPPTGTSATQINCRNNKPVQISVSWTATTSAFATGYTVRRATTSGGPYTTIGTTPIGTTSYTDLDPTLAYTTSYYYVVQATYQSWTGTSNQATVTTLNFKCL
jgi:hypothetical protein